jgi:hypothetical protein
MCCNSDTISREVRRRRRTDGVDPDSTIEKVGLAPEPAWRSYRERAAAAERIKSDCGRLIVQTEPKDAARSAQHIECGAGDVRADGVARKDYASPAVTSDDKLRVYSIITSDNQNISWFRRASPFFII